MDEVATFKRFCFNSLAARDVDPAVDHLRYIVHRMEMNEAQVLWLCFLYGITYHLPSAYLLWHEFPDLENVDGDRLRAFWGAEQKRIPFQTDKMKQRKHFPVTVDSYRRMVGASQVAYFAESLGEDSHRNFEELWNQRLAYFGRFSIWNWAQMLKHVAGLPVEPPSLMIGEPESVSFTDGLAYAFGHPEKVSRGRERYRWSPEEKAQMEEVAAEIREELDVDSFQLETLACAYKKVWRENDSRYIGFYNDRLAEDIRRVEAIPRWAGVNWELLWDARAACVPERYLNSGVDRGLFTRSPEFKIRRGHMKPQKHPSRAVYIVGAPGSGKTTIMELLVEQAGLSWLPDEKVWRELWWTPVADSSGDTVGAMLGKRREAYGGTDALSLAVAPRALEWLAQAELPGLVLGEGIRLSHPRFLVELDARAPLTFVHLTAPPEELDRRCVARDKTISAEFRASTKRNNQKLSESFRATIRTRSARSAEVMDALGAEVLTYETTEWSAEAIASDVLDKIGWNR